MAIRSIGMAMAAVLGLTFAGTANAGEFDHIDNLALTLQRQTRALEREFSEHFRHASHYRHLMSDAREMSGLAAHIHEVAHHGGSPYHLRSDLQNLDRLFHHLEDLVAHIGHDAHHGAGHVHGDVRHVTRLMRAISDTLHHLQEDIEAITSHGHVRGPVGGFRGISIGAPGFRIVFGAGR